MQLKLLAFTALLSAVQTAVAFPKVTPQEFRRVVRDAARQKPDIRDGQVGRVVKFDPVPSFLGTKKIPDAEHPFRAPGPHDLRGPCRTCLHPSDWSISKFAHYFKQRLLTHLPTMAISLATVPPPWRKSTEA